MNKKELIESLAARGFSGRILEAFLKVKRESFLPKNLKKYAYEDVALPLGHGATISQPYTIAFMLKLLELEKGQKVLEIGSGSGYVLALISNIIGKHNVYGIEIIRSLAKKSKKSLAKNKNIRILNKNGINGLPEKAPFDRILISAAGDEIPKHLYLQLKDSGILVVPVRNSIFQIKKENGKIRLKEFHGFIFVPLVRKI